MKPAISFLNQLFRLYYDGFKNMSGWGRKVWIIIIIKLFIIIVILKIFFFQDFLNMNFNSDKEKSEHVLDQLTNSANDHD
jgi:predicted lactoylglutathione lyase